MEKIDIAIIGAGVVGLAIAREMSRQTGKTIAVLERNSKFGQEISSRNSEVIHSGIYYPSTLLKTLLCLEGKELLYEFCDTYRIKHRHIGKLVISHDDEDAAGLQALHQQAQMNNVDAIPLAKKEILALEPAVSAENALLVPSTGIIDSHGLMQALYYQARYNNVVFLFNYPVLDATYDGKGFVISSPKETVWSEILINAAGLGSADLAASLGMDIEDCRYRLHLCKGEYFKINRRLPVNRLIYPIPGPVSLGIHLTIDISGGLKLGPSAFYVDQIDYTVNEFNQEAFYNAASKYLPGLKLNDLSPDYSGIRPKLQGPHDEEMKDFVIREESKSGLPGLINLIGIESPGLTSCLAIARHVRRIL